ncbi:MAG: hypothetical protein AAF290_14985 [Pseudomonadota bacterium]
MPDYDDTVMTARLEKIDYPQFTAELIELATASGDASVAAVAGLFARQPQESVLLASQAATRLPDDPTVLWIATQLCAGDRARDAQCQLAEWQSRLTRLDADNATVWMESAVTAWSNGDRLHARAALEQAVAAPHSHSYFTQKIRLVTRVLTGHDGADFAEAASHGFGVAASTLPNYSNWLRMCREVESEGLNWASRCTDFWQAEYRRATEKLSQMLAAEQLRNIFERQGLVLPDDLPRRESLTYDEPSRASQDALLLEERRFGGYLFANPDHLEQFLSLIEAEGEDAARQTLLQQRQSMLEEGRYRECVK